MKEDNVPLTIRYGTILSTGSMGIAKLTPDDIPEPICRKQKSKLRNTLFFRGRTPQNSKLH